MIKELSDLGYQALVLLQKMKVTAVGVEILESPSGDLRWCLDFRDMASPAIVLLADSYGKKNSDNIAFVLCPLYGRKSKAFLASPGTSTAAIISSLVRLFLSRVLSFSLSMFEHSCFWKLFLNQYAVDFVN